MLKISVQVLNYNGKHHLRECYESLAHQTYTDVAVILVDNGSNDDSVRFTKENFPWVETIAFAKNLGFAKAYNEAMKKAATDYVALLNNDTRVEERWLEELVKVMEEDERIIAVGSKMLLYDNPSLLNHAGAKITPIGGGYDVGLFKSELLRINKRKVGAVCGGAMLVRKNLFLRIGGFDESFFAYFEDVDFCWRAWLYGFNVVYAPSSIVYHKLGGSWGRKSPIKLFLGQRNRQITMIKNLESSNLLKGFFMSSVYTIAKSIQCVCENDSQSFVSLQKANLWVGRRIRQIFVKRSLIQSNRVVDDEFLFRNGLICSFGEALREFIRLNSIKRRAPASIQ